MKLFGFILTIFTLTSGSVFGQVDCDTAKYSKLLSNTYQCKWEFFQLEDTIKGVVIKHEQQMTGCGVLATASITIIKTDNDTIRVLDLCNKDNYIEGQKVKIIPRTEPQFQVNIPCYILIDRRKKGDKNRKTKEVEKNIWHSNNFDESILKTTWGEIINE